MSLRIKILLPVLLLGAGLLVLLGQAGVTAWQEAAQATVRAAAEARIALLVEAGVSLAVERGTTNGILGNPAAAPPAALATARAARQAAEQALDQALDGLEGPALATALDRLATQRTTVGRMRAALDALPAGATPEAARAAGLPAPPAWFAAATAQIDAIAALRAAIEAQALATADLRGRLSALRGALADAAEQAGRERGMMNGLIAQARPPTPAEHRTLGGFAARAEEGLAAAAGVAAGLPATVTQALDAALLAWRESLLPARRAVLAAADAGQPYPMAPAAWFAAATRAIEAVVATQREAGRSLAASIAADGAAQQAALWRMLGLMLLGLGVATGAVLWLGRVVVAPLRAAMATLGHVAGGRLDEPIAQRRPPGSRGADEVDGVLAAAEALRVVAMRARDADAEAATQRLAAEHERGAALRAMADRVDTEVRSAVESVAQRMRRLGEGTVAVGASAGVIERDAASVAEAAQQSQAASQAVTAATEQLTASIGEISQQVARTAGAARGATALGDKGAAAIQALSAAVGKIGGAAALIADIAARTNLLALNATIEAARAGEAGKGFAVVAGEVKQLAAQTARATEDISRQLAEVRGASEATGSTVQEIAAAVGQVDVAATAIAAAVEEQAVTTRDIAGTIARTTGAAREVAARIAEVSRETATTAGLLAGLRQETDGAGEAVAELTRTLISVVRTATPEAERRAAPRFDYPSPATIGAGADGAGAEAEVVDISLGGIALQTTATPSVGARRRLDVPALGIRGATLVVVSAGGGKVRGRLEGLDPASQARIAALAPARAA